MRVLLSFIPTWSHFAPMVPVASVLQARGHDVMVAAPGNLAELVTGTGLSHLPSAEHLDMGAMIGFDAGGNPVPDPPAPADKLSRNGRGFARASRALLEPMQELVEQWQPDLVMTDPTEYGARIAAARHGVPVVAHEWGMPIPAELTDALNEDLADLLAAVDTTALRTIETRPAALSEDGVPDRIRMRFVPFNGAASIPSWLLRKPERPRLCLTFGSIIGNSPRAAGPMAALAEKLTGEGYEVLLAVGAGVSSELPTLPDAVRQVGWLPLSKVLPSCAAVLHHGGSGSSMTGMALGVPQLAMPVSTDQFSNADCINRLGVGIGLPGGATDPGQVVATCARLLDEDGYARRAAEVRSEMEREQSPMDVAVQLESLVRDHQRSTG